jgi:hypothetical protein
LPADNLNIRVGDTVRCRGDLVRVRKLSKKTFRGDIRNRPHLGEYFTINRQFDLADVTEVEERAQAG